MLKRLVLGSLAGNPWVGVLSIFGGACLARALPGYSASSRPCFRVTPRITGGDVCRP